MRIKYAIFFILAFCFCLAGKKDISSTPKSGGTEIAMDFPSDLEWINTKRKIKISDLKGKIVIIHFWKFSSINSIHNLQELKELERKWKNELVVIGVHCPKFSAEKNSEHLKKAISRLEITHPVINDINFSLWRLYQIRFWPSIVLIDPNGMVLGIQSGEGIQEGLDRIISAMVTEFNQLGLIDQNPKNFLREVETIPPQNLLSFPSKIILNETNTELFISDTNHNRILRVDIKTKKVLEIIGKGTKGFQDGNFSVATFNKPVGLALKKEKLFIVDSENHAIREADLETKKIKTLAGNGKQAVTINVSGIGKSVAFNSPWDLIEYKNKLYITMRGAHQIWTLDLQTLEAEVYAGLGNENLFDGKLEEASFAQPTGITRDEIRLFITDSETSSIRSLDYKSSQVIKTILGKGLFEFGDIDSSHSIARLQYPMGICYNEGKLFVADTFNNKIKLVDPYAKTSTTLAGTGSRGAENGKLLDSSFFEPTSLAVFKNKIYVADSNNHVIRLIDLDTQTTTNFEIQESK